MPPHNKSEAQRGTYYWYRENVLSCGTQRAPGELAPRGQQRSAEQSTGIRPSFPRDEKKPPFGGL